MSSPARPLLAAEGALPDDGASILPGIALRDGFAFREGQHTFLAAWADALRRGQRNALGVFVPGYGKTITALASYLVARQLDLDDRCLQRLHFASLLHDIGMLKIERALLTNAKACEKHPQLGGRMLERIRLWEDVAPIVLHHHEWFDGTGYPEQLKGDAVPLEARIISVCEAFDVMISSSSYKLAMDVSEATQELSDCAGTQFDPEIVETFKNLVERGVIEPTTV